MTRAPDAEPPVALAEGIEVPASFLADHVELYKRLHADPELSAQEFRTAEAIEARLSGLDVEHFRCAVTGVVGILRNGEGPVVAFRADTDGLPIAEDTGLDYASTARGTAPDGADVPVMHGCGHDAHITGALGACAYLAANRDRWSGTVVFIFQPGEETGYGARAMVQDGLWDRAPRPDVVLAQHVWPDQVHRFVIRDGHMAALGDSLKVTVTGRQAHGSMPEKSLDPIVAAAMMVVRLQTVVSREVSPSTAAVVTVGTFHAGLKENIIPDTAEFSLNIRTPDTETRQAVLASVRRIISAEAAASGIDEPVVSVINSFPRLFNDAEHTARVRAALAQRFGPESIVDGRLGMGSEDAGVLSDSIEVPGVFWAFGGYAPGQFPEEGPVPVNHSPMFAPNAELAVSCGIGAAVGVLLGYVGT